MQSDWQEVRLGDVADLLTGFPFKSENYSDDPQDPIILGGDNIAQGWLRWDNVRRWPRNMVHGLESYWLREDDVVLAMDRPWIEAGLKRASVRRRDLPALLVQRTARLRGTAQLDNRFLRYLTGSKEFSAYLVSVQTGTAVPHISPAQIRAFRFPMPPILTQRTIASVLTALDEKIELNRRMNETLEAMVRALFRSWFVDFDPVCEKAAGRQPLHAAESSTNAFPSELVQSPLGDVPRDWRIQALDELATFKNGLALQRFRPEEGAPRLPVVKIAQLRTGEPDSDEWASADIDPACILDDGDVVFSWSGSLTVIIWCGGRAALNQHLFKVTSDTYPKWFYLQWLLEHLPEFQRIASAKATTMGHIQRHHLSAAKCVVPPMETLQSASPHFEALLNRQVQASCENRSLKNLRDTLLPKLLSGELRIPEAETIVGKAL